MARQRRKLNLAELQDRFRKRAQACGTTGESPYAVLEAAIAETWDHATEAGHLQALMAVQSDPRIAGILLAPITLEELAALKEPARAPSV